MVNINKISKISVFWLVLIQWVIAYQWLKSGLRKLTDTEFMDGISSTISVLKTDTSYRWYADILDMFDARVWGNLTRYSEMVVGLALLVGGYYLLKSAKLNPWWLKALALACYLGAFLNLNFYLAAGWNSQAVAGINLVMGWTQLILGTHYLMALRNR